jgi:hypothetical protein
MHADELQMGYVEFSTRSYCDVIRADNAADNLIETYEQTDDFKEP